MARQSAIDQARMPQRRRRRGGFLGTWLKFRFIVAAFWLCVAGVGAATDAFRGDTTSNTPDTWDSRVTDMVAFVEAERGLTFDHPVLVDFLSEAEFVQMVGSDGSGEIDDETREYYAQESQLFDAHGLAVGYDALAGQSRFSEVSTLGFYDPWTDRVYIRGNRLTPAVQSVLAHELTHALQAQHFDLNDIGGPGDFAFRSIVEADALRVEQRFVLTLPTEQSSEATAENTLSAEQIEQLDAVPSALVEKQYAPYVLGPMLVDAVYETDGNPGLDALLITPPTEEILISPVLRTTAQAETSPPVAAPAGTTVLEAAGPASMLDTLILLDTWLPWSTARGALDGWAGGSIVIYERPGAAPQLCTTTVIDLDRDPAILVEAITSWAALSGSAAVPTSTGRQVSFEACTRGSAALPPPTQVVTVTEAIFLEDAAIRSFLAEDPQLDVGKVQCYARVVIDQAGDLMFVPDDLLTAADIDTITSVQSAAIQFCGLTAGA